MLLLSSISIIKKFKKNQEKNVFIYLLNKGYYLNLNIKNAIINKNWRLL